MKGLIPAIRNSTPKMEALLVDNVGNYLKKLQESILSTVYLEIRESFNYY